MSNLLNLLGVGNNRNNLPGISNNRVDYGGMSSFQNQEEPSPVGNNLVATPEQEAESQRLEQLLGVPQGQRIQEAPVQEQTPYQQPKGMFGLKGTVRDVIGTLGDAFLVYGGRDRIYGPQRNQERMGEATHGFEQDPEAAIARLQSLGYVDQARKMSETLSRSRTAEAKAKLETAKNSREEGEFRLDMANKGKVMAAGTFSRATEANFDAIKLLAESKFTNLGMDIPEGLPQTFDEVGPYVQSTVSEEKRRRLDQRDTQLDDTRDYRNSVIADRSRRARP